MLAVRREDSVRTTSPGGMSAVAKRPSCWMVVLGGLEEVRRGREMGWTAHLGAAFWSSAFRGGGGEAVGIVGVPGVEFATDGAFVWEVGLGIEAGFVPGWVPL